MTDPHHADPVRYAAGALSNAGIPHVSVDGATDTDPRALVQQVVQALAQAAPPGWQSVHAAFSMAGGEEISQAVAVTPGETVLIPVAPEMVEPIRVHRRITVGPQGPWLRLLTDCDNTGALNVAFDYGDTELPPSQLLSGDAYLRDFQEYPRNDAPVWLLAHMGNEGHQLRSAAVARDRGGSAVGGARVADDEIPTLSLLWARIAVLAAVCRGSDAPAGPRCDPTFEVHFGDNGGCTLARLPGGRAVLSGGRTDSRLLSSAYKGVVSWPDLYRGAPQWVHNLYLDPRASRGLLSFCYWYDHGHWYRSELPEAAVLVEGDTLWRPTDETAAGMPGVWTSQDTANLVVGVLHRIGVELSDRNAYAAIDLVAAAEDGIVSENYLRRLFLDGVPDTFNMAEAMAQLDAADVLLPVYPAIDDVTAKNLVLDYCRSRDVDTRGYPLDQLAASRIDGGWQVFSPVEPGQMAVGRLVFLVADDKVVEQASTSINPVELEFRFASRFADRIRRRR